MLLVISVLLDKLLLLENFLIGFIILVVYRSLIDVGFTHETTPWPGPGLSRKKNSFGLPSSGGLFRPPVELLSGYTFVLSGVDWTCCRFPHPLPIVLMMRSFRAIIHSCQSVVFVFRERERERE